MAIEPTSVTAYTLTSALGLGNEATLNAIKHKLGGLSKHSMGRLGETWLGFVDDSTLSPITGPLINYDNDCHRMVQAALEQDGFKVSIENAKQRYGAHRIACFLGTITSSISVVEQAYREAPATKDMAPLGDYTYSASLDAIAQYVRKNLGISGAYATIGTACSSSAKVFATAYRYLQAGLCDAAVVGGVEGFNETLLNGFRVLGVLSTEPCRPWDSRRDGINIGAAAGFALLERALKSEDKDLGRIRLLGYGETVDGYDMTSPHPEGKGIEACMLSALRRSGLQARDIDYINAHGSGTPMNDLAEDAALHRIFGSAVPVSSTKGWTGHTQGAAGITEAIILMLGMENDLIPATLNTTSVDSALKCNVALDNQTRTLRYGLTNSMGFGGNNATLIFGRVH